MVRFGEFEIPPLIKNGKKLDPESGNVSSGETKEFIKNRWMCLLICITVFIGVASRTFVSNYEKYNDYMSEYLVLSALCFVLLLVNFPDKDQTLPKNKFAKPGAIILCFIEFCAVVTAISIAAPAELIPALVTNMLTSLALTYLCSHYRFFNYRPLDNNDKYTKMRTIYKSCDGISIKESRSFSIVLENTGAEIIPFTALSIERLAISVTGRSSVKFRLPQNGTINPGQTITIVPETEKKNTPSAMGISGFCCFGLDAGEKITTKLITGKKIISLMEEHFEHFKDSSNAKGFDSVKEVVYCENGTDTVEFK